MRVDTKYRNSTRNTLKLYIVKWCLTSTETIRLIRDGEKVGEGGVEMGEVGGEVGGGRLYTYRYTVTTRMTPALRWAAVRAILMFH